MMRRISAVFTVAFVALFAVPSLAVPPAAGVDGFLPKTMTPAEVADFQWMMRARMEERFSIGESGLPLITGEGPLGIPGMVPGGEFEHVDAMAIGIGPTASMTAYYPRLIESMVAALDGQLDIFLVVVPGGGPTVRNLLITNAGIDPNEPGHTVKIYEAPSETVWLRDYGPIWSKNPLGRGIMVNPMYYPGRPNDDDVPYYLSSKMDMPITSPPMSYEGGNFLANGLGTCLASTGVLDGPTGNVWQGWTEADVVQAFEDYYGCTDVIILDRLMREGTTHIDMWAAFLDENTVMIGEYAVPNGTAGCTATRCYPASGVEGSMLTALDDANRAITDNNAAEMESRGFNVVRIPMPNNQGDVWRTYTNVVIADDTILVPTYSSGGLVDVAVEAAALQIWANESGRNIAPIDSEDIIYASGAIHCITQSWAYGTSFSSNSDECVSGTATHCGMPEVVYAEVEEVPPLETGCAVARVGGDDEGRFVSVLSAVAFMALCIGGLAVIRRRR